jgi:hypothetical protein
MGMVGKWLYMLPDPFLQASRVMALFYNSERTQRGGEPPGDGESFNLWRHAPQAQLP